MASIRCFRPQLTWSLVLAVQLWALAGHTWSADEPRPLPSLLTLKGDEPSWTAREAGVGYVVYSDSYLLPFMLYQTPRRSQIVDSVTCQLAQDEYEPIMIGVYALRDGPALANVAISVDIDLPCAVRRVEYRNHWRRWFKPDPKDLPRHADLQVPDAGMPLADKLDAVPAGTTGTFWLTVHAPPGTKPGKHEGTVRIAPEGKPGTELSLAVTVRPFVLPRADIAFGMYSYVTSGLFNDAEYQRRAFLDMKAHGLTSVTVYDSDSKWVVDPETGKGTYQIGPRGQLELTLIKETGLRPEGIPIFYTDYKVVGWHPAHRRFLGDEGTAAAAEAILESGRQHGCPDMVFQAEDEPGVEQSEEYYRWAEAWKESACRMATAMSTAAASQLGHLHDVQIVHIGGITPELIAEARRAGNEVWAYHFSLAGSTPLANRYNTGLYTWGLGLTGNYAWIYYYGGDEYVLVQSAGIFPKPSYEGLREGIDDYRYLRLLEKCVAADESKPAAKEARRWLDSIRKGTDWEFYHEGREWGDRSYFIRPAPDMLPADYEEVRAQAAAFIAAIRVPEEILGAAPRAESRAAKFEASPFLDKGVEQCIAGLKSEDMYARRAAAAALALRGAEGAPAVAELIRLTEDPDVRLLAFRAIGAVGVPAAEAVPALENHLKDQDAFVRLGAVYALGRLGEAAVEPLRSALRDKNVSVVQAACAGLASIGPAAKPAVPDLIVLLGGPSDDPRSHTGEMTWSHTYAAIQAITGIGPGAAAAVPALIESYQRERGGKKHHAAHAEALAAIGPAAAEAVPVLEEAARSYDWVNGPGLHTKGSTLYALYVIRGQEADLQSLADLLPVTEYSCGLKTARLLNKLGSKARPVEEKIRTQLQLELAKDQQNLEFIGILESVLKNLNPGTEQ